LSAVAVVTVASAPMSASCQASSANPPPVVVLGEPANPLTASGVALRASSHPPVIRIGAADVWAEVAISEPSDPLTCLADAVYYEARSESLLGQEAVAQVVVNRTRLASFPSTVCGVVFQRVADTSGCQFSFVCDGSMDGTIDEDAWASARAVAQQALAGFVLAPLKDATHYHAAWMTPYWAPYLKRIRRIGGHVFYR
jgi:spore germination cell wall hydrolase CwlJ-like protein